MSEPDENAITVGETLFIFEGELVRVFGRDGTEAAFPAADLEAFVAFLTERYLEMKVTS